jgi:hypothetical protein
VIDGRIRLSENRHTAGIATSGWLRIDRTQKYENQGRGDWNESGHTHVTHFSLPEDEYTGANTKPLNPIGRRACVKELTYHPKDTSLPGNMQSTSQPSVCRINLCRINFNRVFGNIATEEDDESCYFLNQTLTFRAPSPWLEYFDKDGTLAPYQWAVAAPLVVHPVDFCLITPSRAY